MLAAAAYRFRRVRELLMPLVAAVKAVPVASFVILVLLWVSSRNLSVVISLLIGFPVIYANVLAGLDSEARQLQLAHQCVLHGYSVRRLEELAKARPAVRTAAPKREAGPELMALQNAMREALGLKTTLSGTETRGKITLSYNSAQELEHLYEVIGRLLG